jgi:hypothetical protein
MSTAHPNAPYLTGGSRDGGRLPCLKVTVRIRHQQKLRAVRSAGLPIEDLRQLLTLAVRPNRALLIPSIGPTLA